MDKCSKFFEKKVRKILLDFFPFFLDVGNSNYIKSNSELIFLAIFTRDKDEGIDSIIKKFIDYFYKNSLQNNDENLAAYLLIEIYEQINDGILDFDKYDFKLEGIDKFDFTKKELTCYLSILTNKLDNNIEIYYDEEKMKAMKKTIPTVDEIYFFTHDIFYLTYLNRRQEFFNLFDSNKKKHINEYIFSSIVYCMIDANVDLLGELLICYILINGTLDESDSILIKGLEFIEQYVRAIDSNLMINEQLFLQTYHTILVILILILIKK